MISTGRGRRWLPATDSQHAHASFNHTHAEGRGRSGGVCRSVDFFTPLLSLYFFRARALPAILLSLFTFIPSTLHFLLLLSLVRSCCVFQQSNSSSSNKKKEKLCCFHNNKCKNKKKCSSSTFSGDQNKNCLSLSVHCIPISRRLCIKLLILVL